MNFLDIISNWYNLLIIVIGIVSSLAVITFPTVEVIKSILNKMSTKAVDNITERMINKVIHGVEKTELEGQQKLDMVSNLLGIDKNQVQEVFDKTELKH